MSLSNSFAFSPTFFGRSVNPPSSIAGEANGLAVSQGVLIGNTSLVGSVAGLSTADALLSIAVSSNDISGLSEGSAALVGSLIANGALSGAAGGGSALTGDLRSNNMSGSSAGLSSAIGSLINNEMIGSVSAAASLTGLLTNVGGVLSSFPASEKGPSATGWGVSDDGVLINRGAFSAYEANPTAGNWPTQYIISDATNETEVRAAFESGFDTAKIIRYNSNGAVASGGKFRLVGDNVHVYAPVLAGGGGVAMRPELEVTGSFVIIRNMRFWGGTGNDSLEILANASSHIIFDHCDMTNAGDEGVGSNGEPPFGSMSNISVLNSLVYENVGKGLLVNGFNYVDKWSHSGCAFVSNSVRNPRYSGMRVPNGTGFPTAASPVVDAPVLGEIYNNYIYNCGSRVQLAAQVYINVISGLAEAGPDSQEIFRGIQVPYIWMKTENVVPSDRLASADHNTQVYMEDLIDPYGRTSSGQPQSDAMNSEYDFGTPTVWPDQIQRFVAGSKITSAESPIPPVKLAQANVKQNAIDFAGAFPRDSWTSDIWDNQVVSGGTQGNIPTVNKTTYPTLAAGTGTTFNANSGMRDSFITKYGLDPLLDYVGVKAPDGQYWLEKDLNEQLFELA